MSCPAPQADPPVGPKRGTKGNSDLGGHLAVVAHQQPLQPPPQLGRHALRVRAARGALDKDVDEAADGADGVDAALEDGHLVGDAGAAQLGDAHAHLGDGRVGDGGEEVGRRVRHEGVLRRVGRVQAAVFHEVGVDGRVEAGDGCVRGPVS